MKLRDLRIRAGLSQEDFAKRVGVDQSAVCLWERGKTAPMLRRIPKIAAALDCTEYDVLEAVHRSIAN